MVTSHHLSHQRSQRSHPSLPLLSLREHLFLSSFWLCLNFLTAALLPLIIPVQIVLFITPGVVGNTQQATVLGIMAGVGAFISLVLQPAVGMLSDRTRTRFGRRRPYIAGGTVVLVVASSILAFAQTLVLFLFALILLQIASTIAIAAYQGLIPDLVPERQRGAASGFMGMMTILGTVGSLAVASVLLSHGGTHPTATTIVPGIQRFYGLASGLLILGLLVTMLGVTEIHHPHHVPASLPTGSWYRRWARLWLAPLRQRNFAWVFVTRAAVTLGLNLFMTFIAFYFANVIHVVNFVQATAAVAIFALVGALMSALVLGFISDHVRRVPIVLFAVGCMATAALTFVFLHSAALLWPLGLLFGLGYGAYTSVDWALGIDALPSLHHAGKDLGVWSLASTVPAIVAPLLGSGVIALAGNHQLGLGYRIIFALAAGFLALGALFVLGVQETHHVSASHHQQGRR